MSSKKKTAARKATKRTTAGKARKAAPAKGKRTAAKAKVSTKAAKARAPKIRRAVAKAASPKGRVTKASPKSRAKSKPAPRAAVTRRDGAGHLDPKYAADLRARSRGKTMDDDRAFLRGARSDDSLTEELGEEFVQTVTSGEDEGNEIRDQRVAEEVGGPFTVTSSKTEFASGTDRSNPKTSTREPFPRS